MNTIVLGYKTHQNGRGTGPAIIVAGPEVSGHEQAQILASAKGKNEFPKGITFLQLAYITPRQTAIAAPVKPETPKSTIKESKQ